MVLEFVVAVCGVGGQVPVQLWFVADLSAVLHLSDPLADVVVVVVVVAVCGVGGQVPVQLRFVAGLSAVLHLSDHWLMLMLMLLLLLLQSVGWAAKCLCSCGLSLACLLYSTCLTHWLILDHAWM